MRKNWTIQVDPRDGVGRLEAIISLNQDHPTIRFTIPGRSSLHILSGRDDVLRFINLSGFKQMEMMQELLDEFESKKPAEPSAEVIPIDRDAKRFAMLEF
tara:strand:- start:1631 stop:1930 length:300 start_codon:yes stop_codon:yes gene_type:complete